MLKWEGKASSISFNIIPILIVRRLANLLILPRVDVTFRATTVINHASVRALKKNESMLFPYAPKRPRLFVVLAQPPSHSKFPHPYQDLIQFSSSSSKSDLAIPVEVVVAYSLIATWMSVLPCRET